MKKRVSVFVVMTFIFMPLIQLLFTESVFAAAPVWPVGGNGGTDGWSWPKYSNGSYHSGTDIAAPLGTPVYASYSGTVTKAESLTTSYGKHVVIRCDNVNGQTIHVWYAHLSEYWVSVGDKVSAGQQIGKVGSTGNSTGPHLHYEVRNANNWYGNLSNPTLDPHKYLPPNGYYQTDSGSSLGSPVNLGDDFYAYIINTAAWKHLRNDSDGYVRSYTETGNLREKWHFVRQSDGSYIIISAWDGKCLDVEDGGTSSGTKVITWEYFGADNQQWYIYGESASYKLKSKNTDCVLDLFDTSSAEGATVQMFTYNNGTAQNFQIWKVDTPPENLGSQFYGVILHTKSWKPLAVDDDGYVKIATENGFANQVWKFTRCEDGSYTILSALNGKSLDVETAGDENKLKMHTWEPTDANNQHFFFYRQGDAYVINPRCSATRVLDLTGGDTSDDTQIQIYTRDNSTSNQVFSVFYGDDVQLKAPTLSVSVDRLNRIMTLTWSEVYGEKQYNVKVWNGSSAGGDPKVVRYDKKSGYKIRISLGGSFTVKVEAANQFVSKDSNAVTFTLPDYKSTGKILQKGDANGDGVINEDDVQYIAAMIAENVTPTKEQIDAADVNEDGIVTLDDAILLDDQLKSKPTPTPTPTPKPTLKPTATPKPTAKPTATPKPTPKPTPTPTPILKPTAVPTAKPTVKPTAAPKPTLVPTERPEPTAAPVPTSAPTTEPTSAPTLAPAEKPVYDWEINDYQSGVVTITAPRSEKVMICIAKYRDDMLTDSEVIDLAALSGVNNIHTARDLEPESGESLKIMLWSENLEPLAEPIYR